MSTAEVENLNLLALFDRAAEPAFSVKAKKAFKLPQEYLTERYRPIAQTLSDRSSAEADETIPVENVQVPDLGNITSLGRNENFSLFIPKHVEIATKLTNIFLQAKDRKELLSYATYVHDRVNPYLFIYSFSVALIHRKDTRNLKIPNQIQIFPDKYLDSKVFTRAREELRVIPRGLREPIIIPRDYTASDLEEEHKIAYWREDLGINLHHWHWHLVYPTDGNPSVMNKDRRGELFYYSHQQIIARYNFERFCNGLKRVERFLDWNAPIKEAYFPKLDSLVASRAYPARVENMILQDVDIPSQDVKVDVKDLVNWRDRIADAIATLTIRLPDGSTMPLDDVTGIDHLGNILESSQLSKNRPFYGNLHGFLHLMLSFIHDPNSHHLEPFGIVGDFNGAMRDPVFYRLHSFVDDVFQDFNERLPRYGPNDLTFPGIQVTGFSVQTQSGEKDVFKTFWQQSDVDMSRGLDFVEKTAVFVRFTHLQHEPFSYNINVNNTSNSTKQVTVRIFLAPALNERGTAWLLPEQRVMFIEMDRFRTTLKQGQNSIPRNSTQSAVTIPFERTFRDLETNRPQDGEELALFNFCGCGWPQHLLVPKGTPEGFPCQLFVMITDYEVDKVEQTLQSACNDAEAYCGVMGGKYPDKRPMGYPFNRLPRDARTLEQFLTPNMMVIPCKIIHQNRTVRPRATPPS